MKYLLISLLFMFSGCGYSSVQNELTGQAKKVVKQTPILCDNRVDAEVSMGVMRGGVGSMSTEDVWLTVPNEADQKTLSEAAAKGQIVKVSYDVKRWVWCWEDNIVRHVDIVE